MDSWLEVEERGFEREQWTEKNALSNALAGLAQEPTENRSASPIQHEWIWRGSTMDEAPPEVRSLLARPDLLGSMLPGVDRLLAAEVVRFEGDVWRMTYQLSGLSGFVEVPAWDPSRVVENPSSVEPLLVRRRRLAWGTVVTVAAGLLLALVYGLRHPFFRTVPNFQWLGGLAFLEGLLMLPLLALWSLPGRSWKRLVQAAAPALTVAAVQAGFAATGDPSLENARELAWSGNREGALFVSSACAELGIEVEEARHFHDGMQLDSIVQIADPKLAWDATGWPLLTTQGHQKATEYAVQVTARVAAERQSADDWEGSETVLGLVPSELQGAKPISDLRWEAGAHRLTATWEVIRSRGQPLDDRLQACRKIQGELQVLERFEEAPRPAPVSRDKAEKTCAKLEAERLREIERQRRAEERERERAARAAAAAYRAWARAPLLCRDGTLSPSCVCGQDSRRGCCSHHGGIDGCSQPYPN